MTAGAGVTGNGTASVTITGTAAQINTALAGLAYTGNLNFNGADTLTVVTSDGTATDTDTIAITVNAVNDAPINTVPAAQTVAEDTILPIAGVSVADIDSSALTTTLSVAHGILNVTAGAGVTGNGTASVTIAGTAAQINAALAGLAYTGNLDFNGADTLTVATNDGTATDTDTIAITVNPVNDAPINTVPAAQTVAEDTTLPIAGVSVADIDSSTLTTLLSVAHGTLHVTAGAGVITGNGTATVTIAGTAAQINTALAGLAYTGNLNFNGADTLTVATIDGTAADIDTIAITVNPVNDAPALNLDADSSTTGGVDYLTTFTGSAVAIVDTDVSVVDNDSPSLASATITLTNPHAGDSLIVATPPLPAESRRASTIPSPGPHAHGRRIGCRLSDGTAANHVRHYHTTSTETRIIDVVVNDGTAASNIAHTIVEVTQVDSSAPTLDLDGNNSTLPGTNYRTTFTENGTAVAIADTDTLIGDPDIGSTIASATITLTNPQIGESDRHPAVAGRHHRFAYDPATGTLTLSGVASFADYETALEAIRFSSAGDNPVAGSRIIKSSSTTEYTTASPRSRLSRSWPSTTPDRYRAGRQTVARTSASADRRRLGGRTATAAPLTTTLSSLHGTLDVTAGAGVHHRRHHHRNHRRHSSADQHGVGGLAYAGNRTSQAPTPSRSRLQRRDRHRHRHDRGHRQSSGTPPDRHLAGRGDHRQDSFRPIPGVSVAEHRQQRAHDHAVGRSRHPQCDRQPRRHRQRHARVTIAGTADADQHGAGGPRLCRRPRLPRPRHPHGRDQRRDRHRHRHDRVAVTVNTLTEHAHCDFDGDGGSDICGRTQRHCLDVADERPQRHVRRRRRPVQPQGRAGRSRQRAISTAMVRPTSSGKARTALPRCG